MKPWRHFPDHNIRIYKPSAPGGRYRILYRDDAGKERERAGGKTESEAIKRAQELARVMGSGVSGSWTIGQLLTEYVKPENHRTRRGRPWSDRYAEEEARRVKLHIRPHLNLRGQVSTLGPQDFIRILNRASVSMKPASVASIGKTCRGIVSYAQRLRLVAGDPMLGVSYSVSSEQHGRDVLQVDPRTIPPFEAVLQLGLLAGLHTHATIERVTTTRGGSKVIDRAGVLGRSLQPCFAAGTGLRFGELAELRVGDVDTASLTVTVSRALVETEKRRYVDLPKGGKARTTIMAGWLADPMSEYVQQRRRQDGKNALLWPAPAGGHTTRRNHSRWWKPVREAAGWDEDWTFHSLRHLYAVTALAPTTQGGWGLTLEDVSALLGHHSPEFTARRYLTLRQGIHQRAAAAARDARV